MTSTTFFFIFIPLLAFILLAINLIFAPHNPYQEKDSAFECGFHSFLGQNRTQFSISFFIFALLFLLFDLEILLVYPYIVSAYTNGIYGLVIMLVFFLVLTLGFAFELGKNALKIDSRQMFSISNRRLDLESYYSNITAVGTNIFACLNEISLPLSEYSLYIIFMYVLAMVIFFISVLITFSSEQENTPQITDTDTNTTTTASSSSVPPRPKEHEHDWKAVYIKIQCGYHVRQYDDPCKMENDVNWMCMGCSEIRCGVHAHSKYPYNSGPTRGPS